MLLQRGRFTINSIDELDSLESDKHGLKRIIDLDYMGKVEYEGNAIPLSRMYIEYNRDIYTFHQTDFYDGNAKPLIIYGNESMETKGLGEYLFEKDYSFYEHVVSPNREFDCNFWWNLNDNYLLFFGEEKKELISYFINGCYERDGGKQLIKEKVEKSGYRFVE